MTLVATSCYILAVLFSPSKGLIFSFRQKSLEKKRILREDILRQVIKNPLKEGMPISTIAKNLNYEVSKISKASLFMSKSSLLSVNNKVVILSQEGINKAEQLVRAHRLSLIHI